ncbi:hypothetical protein D9615_007607 [Tricholomella constricta]|uniref:FHA domain-containing protein n=1 Tax=Tricholomella constricta TaxID=117010 RepID=A0A8H5H803_9AGAR|nr:hypothetical protein D9615_007607 [Tricholomella constricta]
MPSPVQPMFPALYLYPLNDSFVPKHISLVHGQRVKIGRQTNAKTAPGERNGYFDSKVLSRQHAEVWEDGNKIFIKDVKSSNGTFINGERLSNEGVESEPFELKSDDIVEFGIDIVGEDNKTIIHHKVAARVVCVFTEQDAQVAARAEQHQQHLQQYQAAGQGSSMHAQPGPSNGNPNGAGSFNFAPGQQRRPQMQQQGLAGMGGMGGSMRPPGKGGLTFDHILSRLQGELQKSRETGAELHTLTGAMNDIHDTLGGNLPSNLPSYPSSLPPVRVSQAHTQPPTQSSSQEPSAPVSTSGSPEQAATAPSAALTTSALVDLQTQLQETQSSLSSHVDKIRALEGVLAEQEAIKREVRALREIMETKRRKIEIEDEHRAREREQEPRGGFDEEEDEDATAHDDDDDDDDSRSIATVVPHELERVEEEDEEQLAAEAQEHDLYGSETQEEEHEKTQQQQVLQEEDLDDDEEGRRRRNDELGRPRTPEPTNLGMRDADPFTSHHRTSNLLDRATKLLAAPRRSSPSSPLSKVAASAVSPNFTEEVFEQILKQVGALMTLTTSLEAQHTAAQTTISALESKVQALEATVKATQDAAAASHVQSQTQTSPPASPTQLQVPPPLSPPTPIVEERESLTAMVLEWKKSMEGQWSSVREDWDKERERLNQAREQWEGQVRNMDSGLEKLGVAAAALKVQQEQIQHQQQLQLQHAGLVNGDVAKHIGLVTPPSPRSLSSDSNRPRRRKSGSSRRGRSRPRSRSGSSGSRDGEIDTDTDATLASEETSPAKGGVILSVSAAFKSARVEEEDDDGEDGEDTVLGVRSMTHNESGAETLATPESSVYKLPTRPKAASALDRETVPALNSAVTRDRERIQLQTAVGVFVLGLATAAVIYRVKPQT